MWNALPPSVHTAIQAIVDAANNDRGQRTGAGRGKRAASDDRR